MKISEAKVGMLVLFNGAKGEIKEIQGREAVVSFDSPYEGRHSSLTCIISSLVQLWPITREEFISTVEAVSRPVPVSTLTKEESPEPTPEEIQAAAAALGHSGGRKGGPARAAKLTAERRREISQEAARKRWQKREPVEKEEFPDPETDPETDNQSTFEQECTSLISRIEAEIEETRQRITTAQKIVTELLRELTSIREALAIYRRRAKQR